MVDFKAVAASGLKVVYDPMYACGQGSLDGALMHYGFPDDNLKVIHTGKDPLFGGTMPDPKGELLDPLKMEVASGYNIGFATDGDADRFGAVDADGRYYSPNVLLFILADHLIENRSMPGGIARTVATTKLLDRVADKHGRRTIETPVGFKFISEALRENGAMMGGEESGGFSSAGWVPEKDGIYACLMALEALAHSGFNGPGELLDSLYKKYGKLISKRIDLHVSEDEKDALLAKANELEGPFLGEKPSERITIDGVKLVMPGGSSFLLRPSGTEPLIRCYLETPDEESLVTIEAEVKSALGLK
jgi:phosphomannomutase